MRAKTVVINGKKVSYFDEGKGKPLLMIHGWGVTKESFIPLAGYLTNKYRVIAVDLPGYGDSEPLGEIHTIDNLVSFIKFFVEKLRIKRFSFLGSSMGGALALSYVIKYPAHVNKLFLQAPFVSYKELPILSRVSVFRYVFKLTMKSGWGQGLFFKVFKLCRRWLILPRIKARVSVDQWKEIDILAGQIFDKFNQHSSKLAARELLVSALDLDLTSKLRSVDQPILIAWGSEDVILNVKWGKKLNKVMKNSYLVEFDGATHFLIVEKPRELAWEMEKFLGELV
jgi:pimeloyl-ACP methyl ester carboxylesterase